MRPPPWDRRPSPEQFRAAEAALQPTPETRRATPQAHGPANSLAGRGTWAAADRPAAALAPAHAVSARLQARSVPSAACRTRLVRVRSVPARPRTFAPRRPAPACCAGRPASGSNGSLACILRGRRRTPAARHNRDHQPVAISMLIPPGEPPRAGVSRAIEIQASKGRKLAECGTRARRSIRADPSAGPIRCGR